MSIGPIIFLKCFHVLLLCFSVMLTLCCLLLIVIAQGTNQYLFFLYLMKSLMDMKNSQEYFLQKKFKQSFGKSEKNKTHMMNILLFTLRLAVV